MAKSGKDGSHAGDRKGDGDGPHAFVPPPGNFSTFLSQAAKAYGARFAFSIFRDDAWLTLTYNDLNNAAHFVGRELQRAGIKSGDRVAILSESSIDYVVHFFAIAICGGISVPLDVKLTEAELHSIVNHCEPSIIFSSDTYREMARKIRHAPTDGPAKVLSMDLTDFHDMSFARVAADAGPEDLAVICYTSGTVGAPKGVEIKTESLLFEAETLTTVADLSGREVMLSILPLNHLYGLSAGVVYAVRSGIELCFVHSLTPEAIQKCLREREVTQVLAVPLYVKVLMQGIKNRILEQSGPGSAFAFKAMIKSTKTVPGSAYKNLLFNKLQNKLGGKLRKFICGGSSLDKEVSDFFKAINIPVYTGYGLTETGPVIAVNTERYNRDGTVGRPLPGIEVKIEKAGGSESRSGEILTRGPHVMVGYHKNPELTAEVLSSDGWFRTGDLGSIDADGYLAVRGRLKSLIVLSSGKKVYPEEVEAVIARSSRVRNVCVLGLPSSGGLSSLGGGMIDEIVTAVVQPTDAAVSDSGNDMSRLAETIKFEILQLCENLAAYKRPLKIIVRTEPFPMTSTMKIKRNVLMQELREKS